MRIHYKGLKKICQNCYSYHRDRCSKEKLEWSSYVKSFAEDNPRIPKGMICRAALDVKPENRKQNGSEAEEDLGHEGADNAGDGMEADDEVGEEDASEVEHQIDSDDGDTFGENYHERRTSTHSDDENETESDLDDTRDVEEVSEDEESNEQRRRLMDEAVATHAAKLYRNLVSYKGKRYADKFKDNLQDIAKEQILETLEERKKEHLQRQIE